MYPSRRLLYVLVALLPVVLVLGVWWGGHPEDLPSFARSGLVAHAQTQVVDEAIERIASDYYRPVPTSSLANASIAGAVGSLHDRFSHYLSPSEFHDFDEPPRFTGIGVEVNPNPNPHGLLIARVFNSSPAAHAGLRPGETIVAVNGHSIVGIPPDQARAMIVGPAGTQVTLAVQSVAAAPAHRSAGEARSGSSTGSHTGGGARSGSTTGGAHSGVSTGTARSGAPSSGSSAGGARSGAARPGGTRTRTLTLTRATISEPVVASALTTVHAVKLGVVALSTFSPGAHAEVREAVEKVRREGARGIVLDLRLNGGGLVEEAQLIASIFIPKGTIVTTRARSLPTETLSALGGAIPTTIPVVVLVDSDTASAAEIVTAALQDHHRATVVGTHTFGKGVFQEEMPLSNGGALDITVGEYFTPDGRNLGGGGIRQGAGVSPEVLVAHGVDTPHGLAVALNTLAAKVQ